LSEKNVGTDAKRRDAESGEGGRKELEGKKGEMYLRRRNITRLTLFWEVFDN
jgi:hypothetical protein